MPIFRTSPVLSEIADRIQKPSQHFPKRRRNRRPEVRGCVSDVLKAPLVQMKSIVKPTKGAKSPNSKRSQGAQRNGENLPKTHLRRSFQTPWLLSTPHSYLERPTRAQRIILNRQGIQCCQSVGRFFLGESIRGSGFVSLWFGRFHGVCCIF